MVATVGSIQVLFNAQYGPAVQSLRRFAAESDKAGKTVAGSVARIDRAAAAANRSIGSLNGTQFRTLTLSALRASSSVERLRGVLLSTSALLGGFSTAFALKGLQEYSDTYRSITNQVRASIGENENLSSVQEKIFQIAQKTRTEYESTAKLFARLTTNATKLGIPLKDTLRVTETIQKAFVLGGSTPTEAAQSSLQLSQGFSSNALSGDELKSVLENNALSNLLANSIADGDKGALRKMAEERKLTVGVLVRAFNEQKDEIDRLFANSDQTVGQAFQRIDNALLKYVGTNESVQAGMSSTIVLANALADNIDTVADSILFLGGAAAGVFGARKLSELGSYVKGVRDLRIQALEAAKATKDAADLAVNGRRLSEQEKALMSPKERFAAMGTAERLSLAQGAVRSGTIADSSALQTLNAFKSAEAKRIQGLKEEREAALAAAKAEVERTKAIAASTDEQLRRTQQAASNKGFIADSNATKASSDQLKTDLKRLYVLKAQRDQIVDGAKAQLEAAQIERDAFQQRINVLQNSRTPEGLGANPTIMRNLRSGLASATDKLAAAEGKYNDALVLTRRTENEIYQIGQMQEARIRQTTGSINAGALKDLTAAYNSHTGAVRSAAEAEYEYERSLKAVQDVERVQTASQNRIQRDQTIVRSGVDVQARKELAEATKAHTLATREANVATATYIGRLNAQRAASQAAAVAMRGLSYTMDFLGGPLGVALVALSGYLAYSSYQAEKAKAVLDQYTTSLDQSALAAAKTSVQLQRLGAEQEKVQQARAAGSSARISAAGETAENIAALESQFKSLGSTIGNLSGAQLRNKGLTRDQALEVIKLRKEILSGTVSFEDFKTKIDELASTNPNFAPIADAMIKIARAIAIARGELAGLKDEFATIPGVKSARPGSLQAKIVPIPEDIKKSVADQLAESSQKRIEGLNDNNKLDEFNARLYGLDRSTKTGSEKQDPYAEALKSTKADTDALIAEAQVLKQFNPLIKDYGKGVAAAKEAQELLTAAQKGGKAVGAELTDVQQLLYGDLSKLTPAARQQAEAIRQMALSYGDAQAKVNLLTEANQKATEEIEWQKDVVKTSLSTFREALVEGKSLWQALGDVALNVLSKIADKLETQFVDALFNAFGSGTGGGFNIFSFLLGGASAAAGGAKPAGAVGTNASGTKAWSGGPTLVGEKGVELLNLPRGSRITPNSMIGEEIDRLASEKVGYSSATASAVRHASSYRDKQSVEVDVRAYVDDNDRFQASVARTAIKTSAPMMEEGTRHFAGATLPGVMDKHAQKPRRRRVA